MTEREVRVPVRLATASDAHALGAALGRSLSAGDLLLLDGPLGAGKTTLTAGLGEGLGVRGPVTSPTFVLARTHPSLVGGPPLVHVDAYRLRSAAEFDDLDLDLERSVVVVEWAGDLLRGLAERWLHLELARGADEVRSGWFTIAGDWDRRGAEAFLLAVRPFATGTVGS